MAPRDNRYAWRLNCEDGSAYGIDPNDYETRDEYNEALSRENTDGVITVKMAQTTGFHQKTMRLRKNIMQQ